MERLTRQKDPEGKELTPCSLCYMADLPICKNNSAECWELAMYERLAAYEDTELTPEQCANAKVIIESAFSDDTSKAERIRELLKSDKDGRVAVLPCKVGDTVYRIFNPPDREPVISAHTLMSVDYIVRWLDKFGKTVFLTREEAEKALEAKSND